ncbi:MAG: histidine phosphotransferase [Alphaproteobacteria bacterium]|nr:histidine phosphotransferase [Alphaproteobacteria bacterium]
MDDIDFSALLCARLCHDLISPVSAARNGIAMALEDDGDPEMRTQAMELTADGLADAVDKLKVYRLAYGVAGPATTLAEARKSVQSLFSRGRVSVDWADGPDPGSDRVRLLTNLVLLGVEAVARGGTVRVDPAGDTLAVHASGGRVGFAPDILAVLDGGTAGPDLTPRQAQASLTLALIQRSGGVLARVEEEGQVSLSVGVASP